MAEMKFDLRPRLARLRSAPCTWRARKRIGAAAIDLAPAGSYDAVQMREVAARANVALGTLYRNFPSKDQLPFCEGRN
jgi:AcrR family transcriptional regulator